MTVTVDACRMTSSRPPRGVSPRQWQILRFTVGFRTRYGCYPSHREIAGALRLSSSNINHLLDPLEIKGLIARTSDAWRNLRLTQKSLQILADNGFIKLDADTFERFEVEPQLKPGQVARIPTRLVAPIIQPKKTLKTRVDLDRQAYSLKIGGARRFRAGERGQVLLHRDTLLLLSILDGDRAVN